MLFGKSKYFGIILIHCTHTQASYKELGLLALVVIMGMLIFSGLTFVVEKDANPDEFISLPAALYWAIITMTSVRNLVKSNSKLCQIKRQNHTFDNLPDQAHNVSLPDHMSESF